MATEYEDFVKKNLDLRRIVAHTPHTIARHSPNDLNTAKQRIKKTHIDAYQTVNLIHTISSFGSVNLPPGEVPGVQVNHQHYMLEDSEIITLKPKEHKKVDQLIHTKLPTSLADFFDSPQDYNSFLSNLPNAFGNPSNRGETNLVTKIKDVIAEHVANGQPFSIGKGYDITVYSCGNITGETVIQEPNPVMSFTTYEPK